MTEIRRATTEWQAMTPERFRAEVQPLYRPAVFRGYVKHWPAVQRQAQSLSTYVDYLQQLDSGKEVVTYTGDSAIGGRFFYQDDLEGFNFERIAEPFSRALARILDAAERPEPPAIYTGAVSIADTVPEFAREHRCDLAGNTAVARIWVGNRAKVSTHYDMLDNVVCAVSGRRRFTLFPPEQLVNLYVGPIDFTLSGQPVSMVSLDEPDLARYPRFAEALEHAEVVELEPGDALYIPKLWWHNVESLEPVNTIVNYWWNATELGPDAAFTTMMHGLLTISHLPEPERRAWRAFFDHYVFRPEGDPVAHIPEEKRGVLGRMTPRLYQALKRQVFELLRRS
ncbi:cupin-like domain-containing protein [Marinimicrobium alkaliphilum]|uniref:cupin-like domain-containing protein n=1 Tax=Marinimicrobium alkaliphilum TaxID=2202654 RepID=UPI000DB9EA74|nr:cupin-like domain-containing protein [Marinimicrobium alkaliphilum]